MTDSARLADMLRGLDISVSERSLGLLIHFRDELLRWNRRINLTAITDPVEALEKHLVDSLTILPFLEKRTNLLDIGSGGGFPAIPLKIVRADLEVWSVDANNKKITFQNHVSRELGLSGFHAWHARAEYLSVKPGIPEFDVIVARAFSSIGTLLHLARPLLAETGEIVAMKGPEAERELAEAAEELEKCGMVCHQKHNLCLPVSHSARTLLFFARKEAGVDRS